MNKVNFTAKDIKVFQRLKSELGISSFSKNRIFLFGGVIRDRFVHISESQDYDFIVDTFSFPLIENLAKIKNQFQTNYDTKAWYSYPKKTIKLLSFQLEVEDFKAILQFKVIDVLMNGLSSQYKDKDFTVNSLIVDLDTLRLIEQPHHQKMLADIQSRKISILNSFWTTFWQNEIRFLRIFDLLSKGFTFDSNTNFQLSMQSSS